MRERGEGEGGGGYGRVICMHCQLGQLLHIFSWDRNPTSVGRGGAGGGRRVRGEKRKDGVTVSCWISPHVINFVCCCGGCLSVCWVFIFYCRFFCSSTGTNHLCPCSGEGGGGRFFRLMLPRAWAFFCIIFQRDKSSNLYFPSGALEPLGFRSAYKRKH